MFKRTHIASAVVMAFTCQFAFAQEEAPNTPENNVDEMEVIQVSGIRGSLNKALDEKSWMQLLLKILVNSLITT